MSDFSILFGRPRGLTSDDRFELEALAAEELEIEAWSIPLDPIVNGDAARALRSLPRPAGRCWLYRGWMLDAAEYAALHEAMSDRDESLVVEPDAMEAASLAPLWIPALGARTAPSRWTDDDDVDVAWELAQELGPPPWLVKDHVKSAKEHWHRACFVPAGADREDFRGICENLVELRGDRFTGGFVIRKYLELATLPGWTPERRRVTDEHRLVFWEGRLVAHAPYYDVETMLPDPHQFDWIGDVIDSPFFVADLARLAERDQWTVIETNDGGSAILPEAMDPRALYRALLARSE